MKRWLVCAAAALLATPAIGDQELEQRFGKDVLIIEASAHACHRFDIYVAITGEQHSRGLMFVRDLPATTGMLFVYDGRNILSMWMKNTFIPLDMIFALADGSISSVVQNTEPLSLRSIVSIEPAAFVLELNAGTTERLVIDENSRIYWQPALGSDE